ncbi:F-box domain-containing protein [Caenorhabditis elegans]|uniref:F-box domain-containing protein n=1 Tax=Caenorhabditis elegans TaxID=6239 RepID=Q9XUW2_CAEEL|nr:F-box domain-containing protein [Caenorhabditis elegans]CAB04531.2 F-box domain-containing protein [Caenorhabditis elegans]|eukprot:NP_507468.2 F-box A protein [Caenorhabditis elegans]
MADDLDEKVISLKISKAPSMSNMPLDIIHKMVENVKPIDRLSLRKVCRNFREIVNDKDPGFKRLRLDLFKDLFSFVLHDAKNVAITQDFDGQTCTVQFNHREKRCFTKNALKIALNDVTVLIENPHFQLSHFNFSALDEDTAAVETVMSWFKSVSDSKKLWKVEKITLEACNCDIPGILSGFQPGILRSIKILHHLDLSTLEEIFRLEQWKMAKSADIISSEHSSFPIENLVHLSNFYLELDYFTVADAVKIRDILLKTANFNSGTISVLDFYDFIIDILHVFDPNYNFVEDEVFYNDGEGAQFLITHNDYELMIKRVL